MLFILGLTICGANCLLSADYKSASKIIARTGQSQPGKGDVIVSTRSGGVGSSTVQFKSVMVVPGRMINPFSRSLVTSYAYHNDVISSDENLGISSRIPSSMAHQGLWFQCFS